MSTPPEGTYRAGERGLQELEKLRQALETLTRERDEYREELGRQVSMVARTARERDDLRRALNKVTTWMGSLHSVRDGDAFYVTRETLSVIHEIAQDALERRQSARPTFSPGRDPFEGVSVHDEEGGE